MDIELSTILTYIFGTTSVLEFLYIGSEWKKRNAEAESAKTDSKQKSIDLQQDQYDYLLEKLTKYQEDYFALGEKMKEETNRHANEMSEATMRFMATINDKCNEIAELKSQIVYFKGLRCYRSECQVRIRTNPKDHEPSNKKQQL